MSETNKTAEQPNPVVEVTKAIDGLKKDLGEQFVTKEQVGALDKSVKELTQEMKEVRASIATKDNVLDDPYLGLFKDDQEFWMTLFAAHGAHNAGMTAEQAKMKLLGEKGYLPRMREAVSKASDGFNEAIDSDGAIFLMPQIASRLLTTDTQLAGFAQRALNFPIAGLTYEMRALVDKNHSSSVAGGVTVSRKGEGVSPDKSKAAFEKIGWKVTKQSGYTDITDELLADAPAAASLIPQLFEKAFRAAEEDDFLYSGSGAGEPLAALHANNPSLITVAKETGQANDTIVLENILKMRARIIDYGNAVWVAIQDIIPQIATITLGDMPIFLPSGKQDVPDTILGRPVVYTEYAAALGDLNDFALVSPKHYGIANRQGIQQQQSIHVRFLQGETTIKFTRRNDGQPLWKSALTPKNGNTRSPFINLAAR